ncbi:similar to involucrin repeat protein [Plenodomus lingam JN3]|uniref:Similar to involucrin repeat protein n=1 Tax=Leptosphaeria maculans (strain JN3 / isolate v23.1.3 / race Av1-4-5-6-7-8) TaxID=985895 RepID=E4ZSM0_LEPMJ|nr:similar to involucrin repeat protein [Plenodomus lingam JN3]CBX94400.1 similar to involucrin repeat protein [Plenodomus lingam JN3]
MTGNGLRTQYPYGNDVALSPRLPYDFPSPSSNYPSGVNAPSPSFFPMAYQISPRFGASAFLPPADVFADGRRQTVRSNGEYTPRDSRKRSSDALLTDPVAMHLLLETAMGDSQHFDILTVEEVDTLKQEQRTLDARLTTVRKKLEAETKIRDATRSLHRLAGAGHRRAASNKSASSVPEEDAKAHQDMDASNKKVEEYIRDLLQIESRMRMIDMQLLMHTAAVLQLTHKSPRKVHGDGDLEDRFGRPDSPASLNGYDMGRPNGARGVGEFDERSYYRSPENLDTLMTVLQNGTHHRSDSDARPSQALATAAKRLQEMNEKLRALIIQANPERDGEYALPPLALEGTPDAATLESQLDFLDQGLRNISAEQANMSSKSKHSLAEVEGRLEGINHQLYAVLSRCRTQDADKIQPPPAITGGGSSEQLNYMEDTIYNLEQMQHAMNGEIEELKNATGGAEDPEMAEKAEKYESTLTGLWNTILTGEEEARERKRERRRLLAEDSDAEEQLSPDEDYEPNEPFSLPAFSAKVQWLFRRATTLKDKQSVLMRQIKQQRELNSKSDAQREAEFERLNTQVLSARSEKKTMENELERAMSQLQQFDETKVEADARALQATQERNAGLEAQLINMRERLATFEAELKESRDRAVAYEAQLKDVQERAVALQKQAEAAEQRAATYEQALEDYQERSSTLNLQSREVEERSAAYEAQVRDAQERAILLEQRLREVQDEAHTLENKLHEAEDDARVEAAAIQAELAESSERIAQLTAQLQAMTAAKEASEARSLDATNSLNAKEEEFRALEGEIVRLTTELTFAKAELDGAYGTRAQRAAASAADPAIKRELVELTEKNQALLDELEALRKVHDAASQSEAEARQSERTLKAELSGMAAEYEALMRDAIQNEKDREMLEALIDRLRDEKEGLERELSDEKVKMLGVRSPGAVGMQGAGAGGQLDLGATSIRMLREDFRKMMRDRTAEGLRALRAEQEERRKLEALVRQLRKESY